MLEGDKDINLSTKEKMIKTGIHLFAKYGYEGTTMRMIAKDADVNIASVSFYFGSKQNYYKSVLQYVADDAIPFYYDAFYKEYTSLKENGAIDKDKALELIEKLLNVQLYVAIDQPQPEYISLLYWEQIQPPEGGSPITEKINMRIEDSLSYLLTQYEPSLDYRKAMLISRYINGGIVAFSEHPGFMESIKKKMGQNPTGDFMKHTLKTYIINSIECCKVLMEE